MLRLLTAILDALSAFNTACVFKENIKSLFAELKHKQNNRRR